MKNLHIDKLNFIQQKYGGLIRELSYNSAKDEALLQTDLFVNEEDFFQREFSPIDKKNHIIKNLYIVEFKVIFDKWKEYYENMFYEFIILE